MTKDLEQSKNDNLYPPEERKSMGGLDDIMELLRSLENICRLSQKNSWIPGFLRELREVLQKYPSQDVQNLVDHLKERSIRPKVTLKQQARKKLGSEELASMTLPDLKTLISDPHIEKEELLLIGQVRLALPKGSYSKVKKEDLRSRIRAAIDNIETMKIIRERAAR